MGISFSKRTDAINFFNYVFKMAVVFFALKQACQSKIFFEVDSLSKLVVLN